MVFNVVSECDWVSGIIWDGPQTTFTFFSYVIILMYIGDNYKQHIKPTLSWVLLLRTRIHLFKSESESFFERKREVIVQVSVVWGKELSWVGELFVLFLLIQVSDSSLCAIREAGWRQERMDVVDTGKKLSGRQCEGPAGEVRLNPSETPTWSAFFLFLVGRRKGQLTDGRQGASGAPAGLLVFLSVSPPHFPSCLIVSPDPRPQLRPNSSGQQMWQVWGSSGRLAPKKRMDREDHPNSAASQLSRRSSRGDPFHECWSFSPLPTSELRVHGYRGYSGDSASICRRAPFRPSPPTLPH